MSAEPRLLLASQMQKAIEICQSEGINPTEMAWEELHVGHPDTAPKVHRLVHRPTNYYFLFDFSPDGTHFTEFSPAEEKHKFTDRHSRFSTRFEYVAKWAKYLAREIKAQDFIATLMQ